VLVVEQERRRLVLKDSRDVEFRETREVGRSEINSLGATKTGRPHATCGKLVKANN
jgi:hypothetical protein